MANCVLLINTDPILPFADFLLLPGKYLLGRSSACDLVLRDSTISRRHAELLVSENSITVKDLDSRNGFSIGGQRLTDGQLNDQGEIKFGRVTFSVEVNYDADRAMDHEDETDDQGKPAGAILQFEPRRFALSPTQHKVLECLLHGEPKKSAAKRIGMNENTFQTHVRAIYAKMKVRSRPQLMALFVKDWSNRIDAVRNFPQTNHDVDLH